VELEPTTFSARPQDACKARTTSNLSNSPIVPLFIDVCDFIENRVCVDFASISAPVIIFKILFCIGVLLYAYMRVHIYNSIVISNAAYIVVLIYLRIDV